MDWEIVRSPSEELAEALGLHKPEARQLLNSSGGDPNEAASLWFRQACGPVLEPIEPVTRADSLVVAESAGISRLAARAAIDESGGNNLRLLELLTRAQATNTSEFECSICLAEVAPTTGVRLLDCGHEFCGQCISRMVDAQLTDNRTDVSCPHCHREIPQRELRSILGEARYNVLERRSLEKVVAADRTLHLCPTPDCPFVVAWAGPEDGPPRVDCPRCKRRVCLVCGAHPYHDGMTCEEHRQSQAGDEADRATQVYLQQSRIRICQQCGQGVLKSEGCDKMLCRCGYKFCFNCGVANATCTCTPASHYFWDNVDNALGPQH